MRFVPFGGGLAMSFAVAPFGCGARLAACRTWAKHA
jgi:hypothetical protein